MMEWRDIIQRELMRPPLVYRLEHLVATILAALDRQKRLMERSEMLIQEARRRLPAA